MSELRAGVIGACCNCRYWNGSRDDREEPHHGWGVDCRRHAPGPPTLLTTDPSKARRANFPQTLADDWCGDFEPLAGAHGTDIG